MSTEVDKFAKTCFISQFIYSRLDDGADPV